ncbi:MAG: hypothetical protein ACK4UN_09325, partial [Limisphaerales bacterium]
MKANLWTEARSPRLLGRAAMWWKTSLALALTAAPISIARANEDPRTNSWLIELSGRYARIFSTDADRNAGITSTTWNRGSVT